MVDLKCEKIEKCGQIFFSCDFDENFLGMIQTILRIKSFYFQEKKMFTFFAVCR